MKKLLLSVMAMLCMVVAKADETAANAILVWVDGSSTCYKLESMPQVTYSEGAAVLTLQGKSTPELTLPLDNGAKLEITYGEYKETTAIEELEVATPQNTKTDTVRRVGKYISGGKLIIVRDGHQYDVSGKLIK